APGRRSRAWENWWRRYRGRSWFNSMPDVLGVQRSRPVHVVGALDDRPAVGKDGELVAIHVELEQEAVVAHLAQNLQVLGQLLDVRRSGLLGGNLQGVAATEVVVLRAVGAVQPLELPLLAAGAIDLAQEWGDLDAAQNVVPDVDVGQLAADLVAMATEDLHCL